MFSKCRFWMVCAILFLFLISSLAVYERSILLSQPQVLASYLLLGSGDGEEQIVRQRRPISLPFSEKSPADKVVYEYLIEIEWRDNQSTSFQVIPDDYLMSIAVNGKIMPEYRYSSLGRGDWKAGLVVDFGSYLRSGRNEILFRISDNGGNYGLDFKKAEISLKRHPLGVTALVFCILSLLVLVYLVMRRFKVDRILVILILLAIVWQIISLGVRSHHSYGHDLYEGNQGHINYIQYITEKGKLPPGHGWAYYHPPLYYVIGAGVWQLANALGIVNPYKPLQLLSLIFYWLFLAYSLRLLAEFIKNPWMYRVAAALLLFWPVGSLAALRIGNDALFFPLFMMSLFYGHKWFVSGKWRDLLLASIVCGIGFFAKISIFPLAGVLGILVLWRLYRKYGTLSVRQAIIVFAIIVGSFFLSATDKWIYELKAKDPKWYMTPFSNQHQKHMNPLLYTTNKFVDFVIPDTKSWFDVAYISPFEDSKYAPGRERIWNYWGKSSMFGQFSFQEKYREMYLAPFMSTIYIILAILGLYGLPMFWRRRKLPYAPVRDIPQIAGNAMRGYIRQIGRAFGRARFYSRQCDFRFVLASVTLLLFFSLLVRITYPVPGYADFRYLLPLIPVMVMAIAAGLMRLQERRWLFILCNILVICFILASFIFYFGL